MYFIVQTYYSGYGWATITYFKEWEKAKSYLRQCKENEPEYEHRITKTRNLDLFF